MNSIMWFRGDLRISDNPALNLAALIAQFKAPIGKPSSPQSSFFPCLYPIYILNENYSYSIPQQNTLFSALTALRENLAGRLTILRGNPESIIPKLVKLLDANAVICSGDYTPMGSAELASISNQGVQLITVSSPYLLPLGKVRKTDNTPYRIFTPFSRQWKNHDYLPPFTAAVKGIKLQIPLEPQLRYICTQLKIDHSDFPKSSFISTNIGSVAEQLALPLAAKLNTTEAALHKQLQSVVFTLPDRATQADSRDSDFPQGMPISEEKALQKLDYFIAEKLHRYEEDRDYPALDGTSGLSVDLAHGTIHPRQIFASLNRCKISLVKKEKFINQLIWREFAANILFHFPQTAWENMNPSFANFPYSSNRVHFAAWCTGKTGVPIIDAAMRQLNTTGTMPNRLRMLVASFLTKDLLLPWQWGAEYFLNHLIDADFANNQLGWQWCAGTGTDASPFFRIFNPYTQAKLYDPEAKYIKTWIPELAEVEAKLLYRESSCEKHYFPAIVSHDTARKEALLRYQNR